METACSLVSHCCNVLSTFVCVTNYRFHVSVRMYSVSSRFVLLVVCLALLYGDTASAPALDSDGVSSRVSTIRP